MAVDKAVDSAQLNADLTTVANAIRAKAGTTGSLSFPEGMADAVAGIPADMMPYAATVSFRLIAVPFSKMTLNLQSATSLSCSFYCSGPTRRGFDELTIYVSNSLTDLSQAFACTAFGGGDSRIIRIIGDTSGVQNWASAFYAALWHSGAAIEGDLNMSGATNVNSAFGYTGMLTSVSFVKNTIPISIEFPQSQFLNDASLVSIANGLNESASGKSLTLHATPKARCSAIMGTVSLDETQTYHIFTADAAGTTTLAEFITNTKGWTLA